MQLDDLDVCVLEAIARGDAIDATALLFLLRRYRATLRDDLGEAVGRALALALDAPARGAAIADRAAWLTLFVEAAALTDDERLPIAIRDLVTELRAGWTSPSIEQATAAVGSCLEAARLDSASSLAADAVDELERIVGRVYRPGAEVGGALDQVRAAFTLLTAFGISGRLPYAMLAEELIQRSRTAASTDFVVGCEAARVLSRLAALHDDEGYRATAVIVPAADYRADAARLLASHALEAAQRGAAGAIYGVALLELESG